MTSGNAVDLHIGSFGQGDVVARWIAENAGKLNVRTLLWRDPNHGQGGWGDNPHVHSDFWPAMDPMLSPPHFKDGGMILNGKAVKFNKPMFSTPAFLHNNETRIHIVG
jgi:hypothetical protein